MARYPGLVDLYSDDGGNPAVGFDGDFRRVRDADVVAQEVRWRIKTTRGDWVLVPECGADLEQIIGLPNSPDTLELAASLVRHALQHDGFLQEELQDVVPISVNKHEVLLIPVVQYGEESISPMFTLDLRAGLL